MLTKIAETGTQNYLWLPGFGYDWRVFQRAISCSPGKHFSADWPKEQTFDQFSQQLAEQLPKDCIVIGWSLGGALAMQLINQSKQVYVLACQDEFCHNDKVSKAALRAFGKQLRRDTELAMQQFQTWCDIDMPASVTDVETLQNTLSWLNDYHILDWHHAIRIYGAADQLVKPPELAEERTSGERSPIVVPGGHSPIIAPGGHSPIIVPGGHFAPVEQLIHYLNKEAA